MRTNFRPAADLRTANLNGAVFERCNLAGANLAGKEVSEADLVDSHLVGADL